MNEEAGDVERDEAANPDAEEQKYRLYRGEPGLDRHYSPVR